jgi:dinuclear metal center YbgI/SA1388 family protein
MKTEHLVEYLNDFLRIEDIQDSSLNGLQIANSGNVNKVALAVDASIMSIQKAQESGADLLFVHHGFFWDKPVPISGILYERIKLLFNADIALYAVHLPLDMHPELGNNAQIKNVLNWPVSGDFGEYHGSIIGKKVEFDESVPILDIMKEFKEKLNCNPQIWSFGPDKIKRLGYVSGGGLSMLQQAIDAGMDVFITGEPGHTSYWMAKESCINVVFGGHYATETLGVKAVGAKLKEKFNLKTVFIDLPTGY